MERHPQEQASSRIAPLSRLPVFFKIAGQKAVLSGDSEAALWKAELLLAAGADLDVFAGGVTGRYDALGAKVGAGRLTVHPRAWQAGDFEDAVLAIADAATDDEAAAFAAAAKAAGAAVNIIDKPAHGTVEFGSIVNRSPLLVAISTSGGAPVFGQAIRARIEALLPSGLKEWAEAAREWRPSVRKADLSPGRKRRFWERFAALALSQSQRLPEPSDRTKLFGEVDRLSTASGGNGRVSLVGAGPGDPELLTLKAIRALQSADVILYDDLVSPEVLDMARREARRICVGKQGHRPSCSQEEINRMIVRLSVEGRHVVRLKGGDPGIFGRATEEIDACRKAGVPVVLIPGITAAQGAASALGISLTERNHARRVQFITGHSAKGALPDDIHWASLKDPSTTTAIYMPRKTLVDLRDRGLAAGLDPEMPALAIASVSRSEQAYVAGTLASLPHQIHALDDAGPLLVLLGDVVRDYALGSAKAETRQAG